jgi:putative addiction module component (TIGR02574 family)
MASNPLEDLLKLPPAERAEIAMALWDSLEPADVEAFMPLADEQKAELDRRSAEAEADPEGGIPWEQVRRDLFRKE